MKCSNCDMLKNIIASIKTNIQPILDLINELQIDENSCSVTADAVCQLENATKSLHANELQTESMEIESDTTDNLGPRAEEIHSNINFRRGGSKRDLSPPATTSNSKQRKGSDERPINIDGDNDENNIVGSSPLSQLVFKDVLRDENVNNVAPESTVTKLSRSIYVTPFSPNTKTSHIIDHLNLFEHIKPLTNDFSISKLVKQNPGKLPLTFVSFKIDVPRQYFNKVANRKIWQPEINVTEFVVKPSRSTVNKATLAKNSPLNQLVFQKQSKHRDEQNESKPNPKQQSKNTEQTKPKNMNGKVNVQKTKQNATKKHWPKRNQPRAHQFVQKPAQQPAFTTPIPMTFCPYSQPSYYPNGYNDLYGGYQQGTCFRRI